MSRVPTIPRLNTDPRTVRQPAQADVHAAVEEDQDQGDGDEPVHGGDRRRGHRRGAPATTEAPSRKNAGAGIRTHWLKRLDAIASVKHATDGEQDPRVRLDVLHHGGRSCPAEEVAVRSATPRGTVRGCRSGPGGPGCWPRRGSTARRRAAVDGRRPAQIREAQGQPDPGQGGGDQERAQHGRAPGARRAESTPSVSSAEASDEADQEHRDDLAPRQAVGRASAGRSPSPARVPAGPQTASATTIGISMRRAGQLDDDAVGAGLAAVGVAGRDHRGGVVDRRAGPQPEGVRVPSRAGARAGGTAAPRRC